MSLTIRHRTVVALVLTALVLPLAPRAAGAATDGSAESRFVQLINQERARAGLPALSVQSDLVAVARRHSVRMTDSGDLHHNSSLADEAATGDPEPATAVTAAAAEPATAVNDHAALVLAQLSARDLGMSVAEVLASA